MGSIHSHSYTSTVTKEATCTETGIRTFTCECEDTYTEVIPKLKHSVAHKVVVSTCETKGYEYDYCSSCKGEFNRVELPLAEHTTKHIVVDSTCKVAGMEYDLCTLCGDTSNTVVVPILDHTWSNWEVTTEPTETSQGIETRTCSSCGETETRKIGKLNIVKDEKTGIEIEYSDEYDTGIEIEVKEVYDGNSFQLIEESYGKIKTSIFDINTFKDGIKVQPSAKVKVRIQMPEEFTEGNNIFVCYVDSVNGTVENIPATVVDGFIEFEAEHFSYYAVVQNIGKVNKVTINDFTVNYKDSYKIVPKVEADENVDYTVTYTSSDTDIATVDKNGNITTTGRGTATITCTVTDEFGNEVKDTCQVEVKLKWWQWIIWILLWGWLWY
ncbi:MAG: Ig-like domain-containing protein, partial [Clostridia bacterium]|nr:Ig-like domain-containing protein [Clostridia bacterium]